MTIKEIATLAKVSPGTVDRVIHGRTGVSKKTADRVRRILEECHYERNMIASSLAMKKSFVLAALVPGFTHENDFWYLPHQGMYEAANSIKDYGFSVRYYYFDQYQKERFLAQFHQMMGDGPDAVVVAPVFKEEVWEMNRILVEKHIPYLFINIDVEGMNNLSYVGQDAYEAGRLAAKLMRMLLGEADQVLIVRLKRTLNLHQAILERIDGFNSYFDAADAGRELIQIDLEGGSRDDLKALTKILLKNHRIKGIFVPSSFVNTIAGYLREFELKEIKLIGFDMYPESIPFLEEEIIDFLITQQAFEQGSRSIRILSDYLLHHKVPQKKYFAPIKIITKENALYYSWKEEEN